ncbi:LOW QUALITY PROTEIN: centromere-associated protein E-like [Cydia pomonella]|uniref:LOW QUALITY PROTEIN: centromere-associated protein E-like n=1 Tax=Cydia pomonella TaxID=82600 RepID=UPI002ADE67D4|nr:LOW QUALITY PROTEIN: centromere-associated protein E-like [Cydia pomonella]
MSFITKRERVFHDLELCDLPPRNEGKLKAYASCTDARAWSHFGSSKTEHLTELIKRNNDLSVPVKYVPTKVIVDTLMASKNLEIGRLKRKIEEFEQMLAAYDELDLDCAQKCEIAKAHAAIKEANKDLDDLCLNLDMSTYTDGFETESFETGKSKSSIKSKGAESDRSRGDAWTVMLDKDLATQGNQTSLVCPCDVSVSVEDPRIDEMKEQIISKDAKLNAMRNSLAIMENDICEPFGIYAHIYTALEKIFGVLSQNSKYKQYLNLMTAGKDIRCIDIKGKILFKMKVLEKFCLALIAPCSKEFQCTSGKDCPCYYADVSTKMESYRLMPTECMSSDSTKRSQLVADIMEHEEMKEILSKESTPDEDDDYDSDTDKQVFDTASVINEENQKRIKDLQECYEDLLNCYENFKHETDCIRVRCAKYEDLELELERLRGQLKEYNSLWNEKEHYRKRSEDLDSLKQQYIVLAEESSGLETKLKAESEINHIKANAIDELRTQNMSLEKRLNELYVSFEKDKNDLQCQLQESECKCMCQDQQIKSLSSQIVKLLEQQPENIPLQDTSLSKENESLKEQLKQYQEIEYEFQDKMSRINQLEAEITKWRAAYEDLFKQNQQYEGYIDSFQKEKEILMKENSALREEIKDKSDAVENLMGVIKIKSLEIHKLTDENQNVCSQLELLGEKYKDHVNLSRRESHEFLRKVKDYDDFVQKQEDLSNDIEEKMREYESLKILLKAKLEENEKLKSDLNRLQNEDAYNKKSLEIFKRESSLMETKLSELEDISQQFMNLKNAFEQLSKEKNGLEKELRKKASQLESAIYSIKLNKKESGELLKQSESIQGELTRLHSNNDLLKQQINHLQDENKALKTECARLSNLEHELSDLKKAIADLLKEKTELEHSFKIKEQELNHMHDILDRKIEENKSLMEELDTLKSHHLQATNNIRTLANENELHQTELDRYRRESSVLIEKLQFHNKLESELQELKTDHDGIKLEKERLQKELDAQLLDFQKIQEEKRELQNRTDDLLAHNNDLEKALVNTRNQLMQSSPSEYKPLADVTKEIQKMRIEKNDAQKEIRELLHKLDESEQVILNFEDEINARDHKIAAMQNHINALQDEVQKLQYLLEQALDAGNDIKNTNLSIEQARQQIEAHHSKASHNLKLELAVLQQSKSKLEDQLSITKSQYELSSKNKLSYLSEIEDLKNDREIIVTDIKQLEIFSVGDSELNSDDCEIERILHSIDRIRRAFEARHAKTLSLEQTLAKVQASSQLVLNKADETKTYFENEKQRILNEKEDVLNEKNSLEKQLIDLKNELNKQISLDGDIIKDLRAEISNQQLIFDKIHESTEKYIMTLQDEIQSLKDLYQVAHSNISELQEKLSKSTAENDEKDSITQNLIAELESKTKEISEIKLNFDSLAKDQCAKKASGKRDISSQTDNVQHHSFFDLTGSTTKSSDEVAQYDLTKINKPGHRDSIKPMYDLLPQHKPPLLNEVQILAAETTPTFDFVRSSYLDYKMKRLGPGLLEHHSIPSLSASTYISSYVDESHEMSNNLSESNDSYNSEDMGTGTSIEGLVDIYHSPSDGIKNSSKMIGISIRKQNSLETYGQTSDDVYPNMKNNISISDVIKPTENYSERQTTAKSQNEKHVEIPEKKSDDSDRRHVKSNVKFENSSTISLHSNKKETDTTKLKLNINLPRVGVESNSNVFTTDNDNNSIDSSTLDTYSDPIQEPLSDTTVQIPSSSERDNKSGKISLPTISNADDFYMKSRSFIELPSKDSSSNKSSSPSDSRISADKTNDTLGQFIVFEDRKVRVTKPQQIFTFVEKLQKSGFKKDEASFRFVTDGQNDPKTGKTSEHIVKLDGFDKSDDNIGLDLSKSKRRVKTSKASQKEIVYDDPLEGLVSRESNKDYLATEKKTKDRISKLPHQKLALSENDKPRHKGRLVPDKKTKTKNGSDDSIDYLKEKKSDSEKSHQDALARLEADVFLKISKSSSNLCDDGNNDNNVQERRSDFALTYILNSLTPDPAENSGNYLISTMSNERYANDMIQPWTALNKIEITGEARKSRPKSVDQSVMVNLDTNNKFYEEVIAGLRKSVDDAEKDHKMQIEAIKIQYDRHIKNIINEHNQGVMSIQSIHEETLRDVVRVHENEVENLRTMSIEAMRKTEKLEKECMSLKSKMSLNSSSLLDEIPTKCEGFLEVTKPRTKQQSDTKVLTKTALEAFDVKPKMRAIGPCTCSLDINISDTIRNIFEQVDVEQRKLAETTYLKYIATKITNGHMEALDTQELSFLHLKVCRIWKQKLNKEEALQKKLDSLEVELIKKQKFAQQHMAELDRKVALEKRRLEEVREAVCRSTPATLSEVKPLPIRKTPENNCSCPCNVEHQAVAERRSTGDLVSAATAVPRTRRKEHKGAMLRTDAEERRDRRLYTDEPPTRLRRQHDRPPRLTKK